MCQEEKAYYEYYFSDDTLTDGIKQVLSLDLVNVYELEEKDVEKELLYDEYSVLTSSPEIFPFICEVNCGVSKENQFFYNGINFFLVVLAAENDGLKVVQFNRPSVDLISKEVETKLDETSELFEEEQKGINVLEQASYGLVVNAEEELLTEGFEIAYKDNPDIMPIAADPPVIDHYSAYSYPASIKVKLNITDNGKIVSVKMDEYLKNTLYNEWPVDCRSEALKAGAYCVKMVGMYRSVHPMNSAGGYNLTQSTQRYKPQNPPNNRSCQMIDSIKNCGMGTFSGRLFFPTYSLGTVGQKGTQCSGHATQYGTDALAKEGYSYHGILNYYYSGSEYSSGDLNFFGYNIGY